VNEYVLEFIVFFPLVAALAILLGSPARFTALAALGLNALATLYVLFSFKKTENGVEAFPFQNFKGDPDFVPPVMLEAGSGFPQISLSFGVDGISLILLILTAIVGIAAVWVSPSENAIRDQRNNSPKLFYASLLFIVAGALGAFLSTDLFFLFAFHELALIPTFLMIGIFGYGKTRVRSAWTITIYLGVGSLVLLAGLIALVTVLGGGTTSLIDLQALANQGDISEVAQKWIFLLLLLGFGVLVSLFPLHTWAPAAYADAPTPVAMLHAGVLKKFGLYGLIRVALPMLPVGFADWQNLMLILLIGNIVIIGLVTIAQKRLDLMLGHSSVMHMGFAFLGIASANIIGVSGAVLLMFAHGCSIAVQFALCGKMRDLDPALLNFENNGGLAKKLPVLGLLFGFGAFASIGLPGFANFVSEIMVFFGAFKRFFDKPEDGILFITIAGMIALWGVVISSVYMLRAYRKLFMGEPMKYSPLAKADADTPITDLTWGERLPILVLIAALLIVGMRPSLLLDLLTPTIESMSRLSGQL
jgi:NADH-quinone oxidoreductase subunit M